MAKIIWILIIFKIYRKFRYGTVIPYLYENVYHYRTIPYTRYGNTVPKRQLPTMSVTDSDGTARFAVGTVISGQNASPNCMHFQLIFVV